MIRQKIHIALLLVLATLVLTGCGYSKPETHSMLGINLNSITTVCGTDCDLTDVEVKSIDDQVSTSYEYTDVADAKGISDARQYHDYLKSEEHCVKIDDFDEAKGSFSAYFAVSSSKDKEGFCMKVSFTADSYTVCITDNVSLEDL